MRGSQRKGARRGGRRQVYTNPSRYPSTPSERQKAADYNKSLRSPEGEELVPTYKIARLLGVPLEHIRRAIADIELQPDHVIDGCAYYSYSAAQRIRRHINQ